MCIASLESRGRISLRVRAGDSNSLGDSMTVVTDGILRMPPELWDNSNPIDVEQRHRTYVAAAEEIHQQQITIDELWQALSSVLAAASRADIEAAIRVRNKYKGTR